VAARHPPFDDPAAVVAPAVAALTPSTQSLQALIGAFRRAIARGLAGEPSSLKMLSTFVEQPRGDECGRVAVVDWGGTHGRAALVELIGAEGTRTLAEREFVFRESDKSGSAEDIFGEIAGAVEAAVGREGPLPLGFVYSFPARLDGIDRAVALSLTKGWRVRGLVGQDVVALLRSALARRGLDRVAVTAVANDTVSTLVLESYRRRARDPGARPADIGLILGTGANQAADLPGAGVRNLESGNFDGVEGVASSWDRALDSEVTDPAPGAQRFEKMTAGHYLGEILRRALLDPGGRAPIFRTPPAALRAPWSLDAEHVSAFARDGSDQLSATAKTLRALDIPSTDAERRALCALARAVGRRTARLIAAGLLGTATFIDPELRADRVVAVDGSVYGGFPGFPDLVREAFGELAGSTAAERLSVVYAKDSTAAGAAVIAAVAARR